MPSVTLRLLNHLFEVTDEKLWNDIVANHEELEELAKWLFELLADRRGDFGCVYIIKRCGRKPTYYKIGKTKQSPTTRLKQLQTGSPEALEIVTYTLTETMTSLENELKRRFKTNRLGEGGQEWYAFEDSDTPRDTSPLWYRYFISHQVNPNWDFGEVIRYVVMLEKQENRLHILNLLESFKREIIE